MDFIISYRVYLVLNTKSIYERVSQTSNEFCFPSRWLHYPLTKSIVSYCSNVQSSLEPSAPYNQSPYEILWISKIASSSSSLVYGCIWLCT
jgi:hypothetical protein